MTPTDSEQLFQDARGCKAWLKTIPLTDVPGALSAMLTVVQGLNRLAAMAPLERLSCNELIREKLAFLDEELRRRRLEKGLPLAAIDRSAWQDALVLHAELVSAYQLCAGKLIAPGGALVEFDALIVQRGLAFCGQQMLLLNALYRPVGADLWHEVHQWWNLAVQCALSEKPVRLGSTGATSYTTIKLDYVQLLLSQCAPVAQMSTRQMGFMGSLLRRFAAKVRLERVKEAPKASPRSQPVLVVDTALSQGAQWAVTSVGRESMYVIEHEEMLRSMRRRINGLRQGESLATLDLNADGISQEVSVWMQQLYNHWSKPIALSSSMNVPDETTIAVINGLNECHLALSKEAFRQPGAKRELTRQEQEDIKLFGHISTVTSQALLTSLEFHPETWGLIEVSAEFVRTLRPLQSAKTIAVGQLLALREEKQRHWQLGIVREVADDPPGHITVLTAMLPGQPEYLAVRAAPIAGKPVQKFVQGLALPENAMLGLPPSCLVPVNLAAAGSVLEVYRGSEKTPRLIKVIDLFKRGADFDHLAVKWEGESADN